MLTSLRMEAFGHRERDFEQGESLAQNVHLLSVYQVSAMPYEHKAQAYTPLGMLKDHAHITVNIFTLYGMFFLILILLFADAVVF